MNLNEDQKALLSRAIATFGKTKQMEMVVEECAEVIQGIMKLNRAKSGHYGKSVEEATQNLRFEAADLVIMANQLVEMLGGESEIAPLITYKLERLLPRIEESESKSERPSRGLEQEPRIKG